MTALVIGPEQQAELQRIRDYAEAKHRRYRLEDMRKIVLGTRQPPGADPARICEVPHGFRVVYSIEQHPQGWVRHLSVSLDLTRRTPNMGAVLMIARELGFAIGKDLKLDLCKHLLQPSPTFGLAVPNLFERMEDCDD